MTSLYFPFQKKHMTNTIGLVSIIGNVVWNACDAFKTVLKVDRTDPGDWMCECMTPKRAEWFKGVLDRVMVGLRTALFGR